ncbi:MAG: amino acid ABC transporter ATP-binding protein [Lentisphaerae bacterium]|nr:amino acid ABC transporter ATP-binding protein [Lentisphaerota bacterium]
MIEVRNLKKIYNGNAVLKDVNAVIEKGEVISIIGPSGTGKSTFLRCLNLLEQPDGGEIWIDGKNILDARTDITAVRRKMGMVFQSFNLFGHLTVLENIAMAPISLLKKNRSEAESQAMTLLKLVGLEGKANALPQELSGGQQQRIAIARALAMEPEIILFDEPTSALDPTMVNEVLSVMRNLAKTGITMIIVTHEMRFARDVSTRIFYMDEGIVYESGPAKELFENPAKPKTKAFLRRIDMLNFNLDRADFDLYNFQSQVVAFAEKQMLDSKQIKALYSVLEELLVNVIFPEISRIDLEIGISEETKTTELCLQWQGNAENPLDSDSVSGELARMIIKKRSKTMTFTPLADNKNQLLITL